MMGSSSFWQSMMYPGTTEEIVVPIIEKGNRHGA